MIDHPKNINMGFLKKMAAIVRTDILQEKAEEPFTEIEEEYAMEAESAVSITYDPGIPSVMDSKIGGIPYMPENFDYPLDKRKGRIGEPLGFLAQINFEQMPPLAGFPTTGILQFYIGTDLLFGFDHEHPVLQDGFRVVYHINVHNERHCLKELPSQLSYESEFPVTREMKMGFTPAVSVIGPQDFRYQQVFFKAYQKAFPFIRNFDEIPVEVREKMEELCDASGSRIGGFPLFTQEDPRNEAEYKDYTLLLFQMDSDVQSDIHWGDDGVCNFFITPEQLINKDFSKVLYHWDCY
ncbi:MAG: YwqG family protein [Bacteroidales bacterium]